MSNTVRQALPQIQLKGILFCPPGLFQFNGEKFTRFSDLFPDVLQKGISPAPSSFNPTWSIDSVLPSDVPTFFATPPSEESIMPMEIFPGADALGGTIQYQFTDGTVIAVRDILYHAYCDRVPRDLLPLLSQIRPESRQLSDFDLLNTSEAIVPQKEFKEAELTLISILIRASEISTQNDLELWVSPSQSIQENRPAYQVKSVRALFHSGAAWKLFPGNAVPSNSDSEGTATLIFDPTPSTPGAKLFRFFELNPAIHFLGFHSLEQNLKRVARELKTSPEKLPADLKFSLHGHSIIQETTARIDQELTAHKQEPIQRLALQSIPSSDVEVRLWIEADGHFRLCRHVSLEESSVQFEVWNLPGFALPLLQGLNGGLGAISAKADREIAQNRRGIKRDRDLKVLKHIGFFALILFEVSHFILHQQQSSEAGTHSLQDFFTKLFIRLGALMAELERKAGFIDFSPALPLDKLCSQNIIDLIQEFTLELIQKIDQDYESIFTERGEIRIYGGASVVLELFHAIMAQIAVQSKGQCFLRPRLNSFASFTSADKDLKLKGLQVNLIDEKAEGFDKAQTYSAISHWLGRTQLLQALLPLREKGFNLFFEGKPLNEMKVADFKPEFTIVEQEDELVQNEKPIDWFELNPKFFFKGVEVDPHHLERLSQEGVLEFQGKIYLIQDKNLPSIRRLETFWSKIQGPTAQNTRRKPGETFLRLPKSQTLEMLALRATGVSIKGGDRWQRICQFYDSLSKKREPVPMPASFQAQLKPYQEIGVQWLLDLFQLGLGGILADDMGLGKTIQTLAFLEILRIKKQMGATLIVVPTSLTYNWISEAGRFTPDMPAQIFQGKSKNQLTEFLSQNPDAAVICTYGLFTEHQEFFEGRTWNILVFDEAQNLKNITAKRTTASRSVSAYFKICLTGTPLENHLGEFYSLLDLVVSGSLGELSTFREKFVTPDTLDKNELSYLKLKSKPLVLRRTKSEILTELPPKIETTVKLPFEQKQEKIYRDIALSWNQKVKGSILSEGEAKSQLLMLTALLRLRQACSDPAAIPHVRYTEEPPKITVLMEALEEITESGESALIFTQFLHTFERVKKELNSQKIKVFSLHGGTSRPEREKVLSEFQKSSGGSVLLMTLKTGGVGLNLVKASYVFHLEPWWNPAVENQATDRAHRIGQQKAVQVYRYLMRESVEEKIEILKERKSARFNALFSSSESLTEISSGGLFLSQADFEYLLS